VTAAVLLNARYAPISISVAPGFHGSVPRRLLESQLIVDESWAVSHRGGGHFDRRILPRVVELLAPAVLAALVVTQVFATSASSSSTPASPGSPPERPPSPHARR
jgi:hypothetical protein